MIQLALMFELEATTNHVVEAIRILTDFAEVDTRTINNLNELVTATTGLCHSMSQVMLFLNENLVHYEDHSSTDKLVIIKSQDKQVLKCWAGKQHKFFMFSNDREKDGNQITDYYAIVPDEVENNNNDVANFFAVDFRQRPQRGYFPLDKNATSEDFKGCAEILKLLACELLSHL